MKRFWDKTCLSLDTVPCWEWNAGLDNEGYGRFQINRQSCLAHRVAWNLTNGTIPIGKFVLHKCDNRKCVNPSHLYLGDQFDNMRDCRERGRWPNRTREANGRSKISLDQAREIKRRCKTEKRTSLAGEFGLSSVAVCYIGNGKNWKGI